MTQPTATETPINAAERIAPAPTSREGANRTTWVKHYAAQALACWATFRAEHRNLTPNPEPGSRPDLGYLALAAVASTTAVAALTDQTDYAPKLVWDLTPEAGALNGEWEEWLTDVLVRHGVNPGLIDPAYDPADFAESVRTLGPSDQPYVCPDCGHTAYLHFPKCSAAATAAASTPQPVCGEPADPTRFVRCDKPAGHTGDRHEATLPGGSYTWGYVPTAAEVTR